MRFLSETRLSADFSSVSSPCESSDCSDESKTASTALRGAGDEGLARAARAAANERHRRDSNLLFTGQVWAPSRELSSLFGYGRTASFEPAASESRRGGSWRGPRRWRWRRW